jgi:hypothetical protein
MVQGVRYNSRRGGGIDRVKENFRKEKVEMEKRKKSE